MSKKVIINESMLNMLIAEQVLNEEGLSKTDIANAVKDAIKNDRSVKTTYINKLENLLQLL